MIITNQLLTATLLVGVFACNPSEKKGNSQDTETAALFNYDFANPTQKYELPKVLKEISGLSFYKEGQLLCVQDEVGEVFVYDLNQQKITETHRFDQSGDYEGIEKVEDDLYILRSDGKLLSFRLGDNETREIETSFPGKNDLEGLTYDPATKRLWLAVKESSKKAVKNDDKVIYSFDLKSRRVFTELELKEKQFENIGLKGKNWKNFKPSGIAFHPKTGEIYLLSSMGHRLLIINRRGTPLKSIELNPLIFRQPEGISFTPDGVLYIASEGENGSGYILKFTPTKPL